MRVSDLTSVLPIAGVVVGIWAAGLSVLYLLGMFLSSRTLAAIRQNRVKHGEHITVGARLRGVYRVLILIAAIYFYISIPIVALAMLALFGLLMLIAPAAAARAMLLAILLLMMLVFSLYTILRALLLPVRLTPPGPELRRVDAPELWSLVYEVAARVGARPVERVFIGPTAEIDIVEQGGLVDKLRDQSERWLFLGVASLTNITQGQLRAILAQEYAHFVHRETAGGDLSVFVMGHMVYMTAGLNAYGLTSAVNPYALFLRAYSRIFSQIALGASRLHDIQADQVAAETYGAETLADALRNIVRLSITFDIESVRKMRNAISLDRPPADFYTVTVTEGTPEAEFLESRIVERMARPVSPYDVHPALNDRLDFLKSLGTRNTPQVPTPPAADLLLDLNGLRDLMALRLFETIPGRSAS